MKHSVMIILATIGLALPFPFAQIGASAAQDGVNCLSKQEIQQRVDSGQLRQLSEVKAAAGVEGKIISSTPQVCEVNGALSWQFNVMDSYGVSKPVTLPAN